MEITQQQIDKRRNCNVKATLSERKLLFRMRQEFNRNGKVTAIVEWTTDSFTIRFIDAPIGPEEKLNIF
jgi:hypothetical protein